MKRKRCLKADADTQFPSAQRTRLAQTRAGAGQGPCRPGGQGSTRTALQQWRDEVVAGMLDTLDM